MTYIHLQLNTQYPVITCESRDTKTKAVCTQLSTIESTLYMKVYILRHPQAVYTQLATTGRTLYQKVYALPYLQRKLYDLGSG